MSYVSEAADLIRSLNSNNSVLSPDDYLIISEWEKQEIPLDLVLTSLREYFLVREESTESSLLEIKPKIQNSYAEWLIGINGISRKDL
jgi:hypothetical protein